MKTIPVPMPRPFFPSDRIWDVQQSRHSVQPDPVALGVFGSQIFVTPAHDTGDYSGTCAFLHVLMQIMSLVASFPGVCSFLIVAWNQVS